jgi:hypothetical protein
MRVVDTQALEVRITGTPVGRRVDVIVGDRSAPLTSTLVMVLLRLHWAALTQPGGWLSKESIDPTDIRGWKRLSRLREVLDPILGEPAVEVFAGEGRYRLSRRLHITEIGWQALSEIRDAKLQRILADLRAAMAQAA